MTKPKKIRPAKLIENLLYSRNKFTERMFKRAPEMSECGNFFIGNEIYDDGDQAGIFYTTKDGGEGPFYCFYTESFKDE